MCVKVERLVNNLPRRKLDHVIVQGQVQIKDKVMFSSDSLS